MLFRSALPRPARKLPELYTVEPAQDGEREVMLLIGESLSNKETGQRLHLSEGTVKLHLHSIYNKLGLRNRTALAALAAKYERAGGASPRAAAPRPITLA